MKKWFILIVVSSIMLISLSSSAYACVSTPRLELRNDVIDNQAELLSFKEYYNESAVLNQLAEINSQCNCDLTDSDISILKNYLINGYSVKEQTDEEYALFLEEAEKANKGRPKDCLDYVAVSRRGDWTGYIKTGSHYTRMNGCSVPMCAGSPRTNILWNELTSAGQIPPLTSEEGEISPQAGSVIVKSLTNESILFYGGIAAAILVILIAIYYFKAKKH